ncbi:MAG: hypothetical protein GKR93_11345 [Gammaproteobacteria bacterium]|nr:hypothetical protein [Gammaproteobacteria bacterium]
MSLEKNDDDTAQDFDADLEASILAHKNLINELSFLFDREIVSQAEQIDIADINLNKDIIDCISAGVKKLKELKGRPKEQQGFVNSMAVGEKLVLCLWIKDMDLLDKIQAGSYLDYSG